MTEIVNDREFELFVQRNLNYDSVGKHLVNKVNELMGLVVNNPQTKLKESIKYRIEGNDIIIYSESPIPIFLDQGTKPHKIRAKPGGALAFRSQQVSSYKSGKKINFGDKVVVKEVNHPGISARPFISQAMHLSQQELNEKIL
jgi:hypothetical protein